MCTLSSGLQPHGGEGGVRGGDAHVVHRLRLRAPEGIGYCTAHIALHSERVMSRARVHLKALTWLSYDLTWKLRDQSREEHCVPVVAAANISLPRRRGARVQTHARVKTLALLHT